MDVESEGREEEEEEVELRSLFPDPFVWFDSLIIYAGIKRRFG